MKPRIEEEISVIIPCYNAELLVGETISSVLAQTWPSVEIIVVDDGSTDGSWQVIHSFGDKITALRQANGGGCRARNVGARMAEGGYLMFLDADDLLAPNTLAALVAALRQHGDAGIAGCRWQRLVRQGEAWAPAPSGVAGHPPGGDLVRGWLAGWYIPPCALLWRRSAYEATGGWDESLAANQDGDLVLRALLAGVLLVRTGAGEGLYRDHGTERLSTSKTVGSERALRSRMRVLAKVAERLSAQSALDQYAVAIGQAYHGLARNGFATNLDLARECVRLSEAFAGPRAVTGSFSHRLLCRLLGVERKERLAQALAHLGLANGLRRRDAALRRLSGTR